METGLLAYTLCTGGYIFEVILLGILLSTHLFERERSKLSVFRLFGALVLFMDAFATIAAIVLSLHSNWESGADGISRAIDGFVFLFIYLAGETLIQGRAPSRKKSLMFGAPYLAIFIWQIFDHGHFFLAGCFIAAINLIFYCYMVCATYVHDRKLKEKYSNFDGHTAKWFLIIAFMTLTDMVFWFMPALSGIRSYWLGLLYTAAMAVTWAFFASCVIKQKEASESILDTARTDSSAEGKTEESISNLAASLQELMEKEKIYLHSDLTLESIAKSLNTNSTYVYKCLHDELGTSFYEYINGKRIDYSKTLLAGTDEKIESIAIQSGFNSSRAFLRVFKQITGETPTSWRSGNS